MLEPPNPPNIDFWGFFFFIMITPKANSHAFSIFCAGKNGEKEVTLFMAVLSMERGELQGLYSLSISSSCLCRLVSDWSFFFQIRVIMGSIYYVLLGCLAVS